MKRLLIFALLRPLLLSAIVRDKSSERLLVSPFNTARNLSRHRHADGYLHNEPHEGHVAISKRQVNQNVNDGNTPNFPVGGWLGAILPPGRIPRIEITIPPDPSCECDQGLNEEVGDPVAHPDRQCGGGANESVHRQPRRRCPRCVCMPGYVRNRRWECIAEADCNRCERRSNEYYVACGSPCVKYCSKPIEKYCSLACRPGCRCAEGYIRSSRNGPCVPIHECPPRCGRNQEYSRCITGCEPVCGEKQSPACYKGCLRDGCKCKPGFKLRETPERPDEFECVKC